MTVHISILLDPIVSALVEPFRRLGPDAPISWLIDCTFGGGGHTAAFLEAFAKEPDLARHRVLALDQDASAIERGRERFSREIAEGRLELVRSRFGRMHEAVADRPVLGILADLGFSSDQIEDPARGLSFLREGPLDMRLDPDEGLSCRELLAQLRENEIADLIWRYGEERFSRRIARAIVERRQHGALPSTTKELAELVTRAVPPPARHGRIHPATRTFQALRIAVNDELGELDSLLKHGILKLQPGGRAAILSFHSLEDREVKRRFQKAPDFRPLTKKPQEADEKEVEMNPRARSAKLRVAERLES